MKKKHLTERERFFIKNCIDAGDTITEIARRVSRGKSTISEEISDNGGRKNYDPEKAQKRADLAQYHKKKNCLKVAMDPYLAVRVETELRQHFSPEEISGRLKLEQQVNDHTPYASPKAIRNFAESRRLDSYFFYTRCRPKGKRGIGSGITDRVFVDMVLREGVGHWEGDFIVSSKSNVVLLVLVERVTRKSLLLLIPYRENDFVNQTIARLLKGYLVKSLTLDNDVAFKKHQDLSFLLGAPVYFARPYTSTDKALVENTNKWIRSFIPKKTDLALVSYEKVLWVQNWLNGKPRACLGYSKVSEIEGVIRLGECSY